MCPADTRCHSGGVVGPVCSAIAATGVVPSRVRLRYVAGEREDLQHAARTDPEIRLAEVAEHHDVGGGPIRELELVAEIDNVHGDTCNARSDRAQVA